MVDWRRVGNSKSKAETPEVAYVHVHLVCGHSSGGLRQWRIAAASAIYAENIPGNSAGQGQHRRNQPFDDDHPHRSMRQSVYGDLFKLLLENHPGSQCFWKHVFGSWRSPSEVFYQGSPLREFWHLIRSDQETCEWIRLSPASRG